MEPRHWKSNPESSQPINEQIEWVALFTQTQCGVTRSFSLANRAKNET